MTPRLSACIITYNEERNIRACLESLRWADEIVVVDSGSDDRTREIAREWTDRVEAVGPVGRLEGALLHYSYLDLADQLRQTLSFTGISAAELYRSGHRASLLDLSARPFWAFFQRYLMRWGILDGVPGLMMAANHSFCVFLKYARLWEMEWSGPLSSSREEHPGDGGER